jgi:Tryptophan-associated transmembrane protein (Trp_oprn_chp)
MVLAMRTSMRNGGRPAAAAPIAGIVAAMVFAGALAATWVEQRLTRTVGDVAVGEMRTTTGMELVPVGVVAGLVAVLCGVAVLVTRGMTRRVAAVLLAVSGGGVVAAAVVGVFRAVAMDGRITAAPWIAGPAAVVVVAAGVLGWGSTARGMPARYDVDATPGDQEWQMATDPGDARRLDGPAS